MEVGVVVCDAVTSVFEVEVVLCDNDEVFFEGEVVIREAIFDDVVESDVTSFIDEDVVCLVVEAVVVCNISKSVVDVTAGFSSDCVEESVVGALLEKSFAPVGAVCTTHDIAVLFNKVLAFVLCNGVVKLAENMYHNFIILNEKLKNKKKIKESAIHESNICIGL